MTLCITIPTRHITSFSTTPSQPTSVTARHHPSHIYNSSFFTSMQQRLVAHGLTERAANLHTLSVIRSLANDGATHGFAVRLCDLPAQGQPDARATWFGGEERHE